MKIQKQPDYLVFADEAKTGEVQDFPNILRGWGVTIEQTQSKPPMEWMNGAFNRIDKNMLYLLQQGIPEWNNAVLYPAGAVIKYKNKIYIAKAENDNSIPSTSTTKWDSLIKDATSAVAGIVKLNAATNSTSTTEAATPSAVKTAYDLANGAVKKSGDTMTGDLTIKKNGATVFLSNASNNGMAIRAEPSGNVSFNSSTNGSLELKMHYDKTSNRFVFSNLSDVTVNNKSVLKQGDFGLGAYGDSGLSCSIINNIDTYSLTNGFYPTAATTAGGFPSGFSEYGTLIVNMRSTSAYKSGSQLYIDSARGRAAFRTCHNNNDYNEWKEIVTTENINNYGLPVGIPQPWPTATPPAGWLKCNGATFDKTLYPKLAIAYPSGKLPDLRGEFIRGLDDGRGIDTGRTILSNQEQQLSVHKHLTIVSGDLTTSNQSNSWGISNGNGTKTGVSSSSYYNKPHFYTNDASEELETSTLKLNPDGLVGSETRPRNVAFLYIVKAE